MTSIDGLYWLINKHMKSTINSIRLKDIGVHQHVKIPNMAINRLYQEGIFTLDQFFENEHKLCKITGLGPVQIDNIYKYLNAISNTYSIVIYRGEQISVWLTMGRIELHHKGHQQNIALMKELDFRHVSLSSLVRLILIGFQAGIEACQQ